MVASAVSAECWPAATVAAPAAAYLSQRALEIRGLPRRARFLGAEVGPVGLVVAAGRTISVPPSAPRDRKIPPMRNDFYNNQMDGQHQQIALISGKKVGKRVETSRRGGRKRGGGANLPGDGRRGLRVTRKRHRSSCNQEATELGSLCAYCTATKRSRAVLPRGRQRIHSPAILAGSSAAPPPAPLGFHRLELPSG